MSALSAAAALTRGDQCPACDRFIGPALHCPYCGQEAAPAPGLRALRRTAFLLATLGLAALYLMARSRELPVVTIGDITPMMNYAYVRVEGEIAREPYTVMRNGRLDYCSFLLDDGTGTVRVQTWRDTARLMERAGALPQRGDRVSVAGSLQVTAGEGPRLRLHTPDHLQPLAGLRP